MKHKQFNFILESEPLIQVSDLEFTIIDEYIFETEDTDSFNILLESYGHMQEYNLNVEFEEQLDYTLYL